MLLELSVPVAPLGNPLCLFDGHLFLDLHRSCAQAVAEDNLALDGALLPELSRKLWVKPRANVGRCAGVRRGSVRRAGARGL